MITDIITGAGLVSLTAGIWLEFGLSWALIAFGSILFCVGMGGVIRK